MIFDFIKRLRRKRSRAIFRFFDGTKTRAVDPYAVYRFLDSHPQFKWEQLEEVDEGDGLAADTTIAAAREAFGLVAFEDAHRNSLTAAEVLNVLSDFGDWVTAAKKKLGPGSTSSSGTAGRSSSAMEDPNSTMSFSSAAG
jgi:hypothetical protein